jgi:predicted RNase H-like nuclease (RuvC/YqgF family)
MKQSQHLAASISGLKSTDEIARKAAIQTEIGKRQLQIDRLMMRNRTLEEKLAELQRFKRVLDDDLYDMDHRERPEVRRLGREVAQRQEKQKQSAQRVQITRARVIEKRAEYQEIQASQNLERFNELTMQRYKLERRQAKWKLFLRSPRESFRSIEFFSVANGQKRAHLSEQLQRAERGRLASANVANSLVGYSDLLAALIEEHMTNWQMDPAATGSPDQPIQSCHRM